MKIFLGDLVHDWEKVSLWTFPLNVGYIATYARAKAPEPLEVRLFKRPEAMITAIRSERPDVVALAHYVWNTNLNHLVFAIARDANPSVLNVGGGPCFTSHNAHEVGARRFFARTPACDAYVVNQGERGFAELVLRFLDLGGDVARLRRDSVPGSLVNDLVARDRVHVGESLDPIRDLDEIPSPYLSGLLDSFFDEPFVPILETNRSCPYRCTFCAWGIGTGKLATFSDDRVLAEIDYLGRNCIKSQNLFIADANFAVLERDARFARRLHENRDRYGFPGHVCVQWNKTRPDRVMNVAREFQGMSEVGASMQSLNAGVLKAVKRTNLSLDTVAGMIGQLRAEGVDVPLFTELILGLPHETWDSHLEANKKLVDLGAEVINYNLHLLPGTEMDAPDSRQSFFRRTGYRLHDNAFGIYDGVPVFEGQEVVLETSTMSLDELRSFRFIHFLIQFMWSRRWYHDYLELMRGAGVHPIDMIVRITRAFAADSGEMGEIYRRFKADHDLENFETFESLAAFWSRPENMERLRSGEYGKLNYVYTFDIVLDHYDAFNQFLAAVTREAVADLGLDDDEAVIEQVREVLEFTRDLRISITDSLDAVVATKRRSFTHDLVAWRQNGYRGRPARISTSGRFEFEFYLPDTQRAYLEHQLEQYRSHNRNLTMRKMSEYTDPNDFQYKVRPVGGKAAVTDADEPAAPRRQSSATGMGVGES